MKRFISLLLSLIMVISIIPMLASAEEEEIARDPYGGYVLTETEKEVIATQSVKNKVRTVITTDGEVDDMASIIRWLHYANEFDILGIVLSASRWHYAGGAVRNPDGTINTTRTQYRWCGLRWPLMYLEKYEAVYDNLVVHAPDMPTPDYLRSIYKIGNIKQQGEMTEETEGSNFIKDVILANPDGENLVVNIWGGANTLCRALKSIEDEYKNTPEWDALYKKISDEVVAYFITDQDQSTPGSLTSYIRPNWPLMRVFYNNNTYNAVGYSFTNTTYFQRGWTDTIRRIDSPLGSEYLTTGGGWDLRNAAIQQPTHTYYTNPVPTFHNYFGDDYPYSTWGESENRGGGTDNGAFMSEGDNPAYWFLQDVGLRGGLEHPEWGGWGGRFFRDPARTNNEYTDSATYTTETIVSGMAGTAGRFSLQRWLPDIQSDFSARAQWAIKDKYEDANHNPQSGVINGLDLSVLPGQAIDLKGAAYDPDGDELSYSWYRYNETDTYGGNPNTNQGKGTTQLATTKDFTYTVPADAQPGQTIHLIFEVSDAPSNTDTYGYMKAYKRVVLTVAQSYAGRIDSYTVNNAQVFAFIPDDLTGTVLDRWTAPIIQVFGDKPYTAQTALQTAYDSGLAEIASQERAVISFVNPVGASWGAADVETYKNIVARYVERPTGGTGAGQWQNGIISPSGAITYNRYAGYEYRGLVVAEGSGADFATRYMMDDTLGDRNPTALLLFNVTELPGANAGSLFNEYPAVVVNGTTAVNDAITALNQGTISSVSIETSAVTSGFDSEILLRGMDEIGLRFMRLQMDILFNIAGVPASPHMSLVPIPDYDKMGMDVQFRQVTVPTSDTNATPLNFWYHQYIPGSIDRTKPGSAPLVMALHGNGEKSEYFAKLSGWPELGDQEGFMTVIPDDQVPRSAFQLHQLLDQLVLEFPFIDTTRIYITGFSMGSNKAWQMISTEEFAKKIAAISPWDYLTAPSTNQRTVLMPTFYMHGQQDSLTPLPSTNQASRDRIAYLFDMNKVGSYTFDAAADPRWGVSGDTVETVKATFSNYNIYLHSFASKQGNGEVYTVLADAERVSHTLNHDYAFLAWDFMKQFVRKMDGTTGYVEESDEQGPSPLALYVTTGKSGTFFLNLGDAVSATLESSDPLIMTVSKSGLTTSGPVTVNTLSQGTAYVNIVFTYADGATTDWEYRVMSIDSERYADLGFSKLTPKEAADAAYQRRVETGFRNARAICTSDNETDDMNSMIRYIMYANDIDIGGIIYSSSTHHWAGDGKGLYTGGSSANIPMSNYRWCGSSDFQVFVEEYRKVQDNLRVHDPNYPDADYLRDMIFEGNVQFYNEMTNDTPGSDLIKHTLLDERDESPIHLSAWGGASTIARALKSIQDEYSGTPEWPAIYARISRLVKLNLSGTQDTTYTSYIATNWPNIEAANTSSPGQAIGFQASAANQSHSYFLKPEFMLNHMLGFPYMAHYQTYRDGLNLTQISWQPNTVMPVQLGTIYNGHIEQPMGWEDRFITGTTSPSNVSRQGLNSAKPDQPNATGTYIPAPWAKGARMHRLIDPVGDPRWAEWGEPQHEDFGNAFQPTYWGGTKPPAYSFYSEGDSQCYLGLINNGLRGDESFKWGGWGGRYARSGTTGLLTPQNEVIPSGITGTAGTWSLQRFIPDMQRDFATRLLWSITPKYEDANHAPVVSIAGGVDRSAVAGETLNLKSIASDPDGDPLTYRWYQYQFANAGTLVGNVTTVELGNSPNVTFTVPANAAVGDQFHLILEVDDRQIPNPAQGDLYMKSYQRVVIKVRDPFGGYTLTNDQKVAIATQSAKKKINTIVTTDGEHDDMNSMIRYLSHANEFNTLGLILTSSQWHQTGGTIHYAPGDEVIPGLITRQNTYQTSTVTNPDGSRDVTYRQNRCTGMQWIPYFTNLYAECYDNLVAQDPDYPTPEYLRSIFRLGNTKVINDMYEKSPGSLLIKDAILNNPDGEDLYVQIWGGASCLAAALWQIENEYKGTADWERIYNKVSAEVMGYNIQNQDDTYTYYISQSWPKIRWINNASLFAGLYSWTSTAYYTAAQQTTWFRKDWTDTLLQIGSPLAGRFLCAGGGWDLRNNATTGIQNPDNPWYTVPFVSDDNYPFSTWGEGTNEGLAGQNQSTWTYNFTHEGDTPSFLSLMDFGLRSMEDPTWGGWWGRFALTNAATSTNVWSDNATDVVASGLGAVTAKNYTFARWMPDFQAEFSNRAQWSITGDYAAVNHHPQSAVMNGLDLIAMPGETINLNGVAYDPDGDELTYNWWRYADVDTAPGTGTIVVADTAEAAYTIPTDARNGDTIHLIFEISDAPSNTLYTSLKNYKRVVITVNVDKNALAQAIAEFEDLTEREWLTSSWAEAKAAYDAAVLVYDDAKASKNEVDDATQTLNDAISALVRIYLNLAVGQAPSFVIRKNMITQIKLETNAESLSFTSSNSVIATVTQNGVVTGKSIGVVVIQIKDANTGYVINVVVNCTN